MTQQEPRRRQLLGGEGSNELASVTAFEQGAGLVVAISGEVDISNVDSVANVIHALPNVQDGLLIDLSDVRYLDSSAVSLLHDLAMRLRSRSQRLIVVSPPQTPPRRVLDLTALYINAPVTDAFESGVRMLSSNEPL
ncbi:MAG: STAS domain-containing protein [Acidobacteriota bacterium]|nr:STAS domain-containing protein [Acidobacteriota bacterium]